MVNRILPSERMRAVELAPAFRTAVFRSLAADEDRFDARTSLGSLREVSLPPGAIVADAFDAAYESLVGNYRIEYTFKNELISKIVFGRHSPATASAQVEQPMGSSEADLLLLNGTSTVYEIKTDFDDHSRLSGQLADYSRYVDLVNVVVSDSRARTIESLLPRHVGLLAWKRSGALSLIRQPTSNLENLESGCIFELLRTDEALSALAHHLGYERDVPRGHLRRRLHGLFSELDTSDAHRLVVHQLRSRGSSARALAKVPWFPASLRAAAYSTELSQVGIRRVVERLSTPFAIMMA